MPPRRRPASGYHGLRARPSGRFDAEIRSGDERIRLGTFDTAHEAARAYDAVAWRLGRSRRSMNFHDVYTREQADMLAPPPPVITQEQQRRQRELEQRLLIAERDEALRLEWARRFPENVAATEAFYAQKEEEKPVAACCHVSVPPQPVAAGPTTWRLSNVPPPLTAASPAATGYGGMCDVSLGQRAATVVLTFALRGGLFWHFIGAGGLIC
nr:ethylene-responsive transcription factor ERF110-like [Lolium perenne]